MRRHLRVFAACFWSLLSVVTKNEDTGVRKLRRTDMDRQKVALITGVSSGIGRATATALVNDGFRVFGTMRDPARLGQELDTVELISMDVRNENSARSAVQSVLERAGRIDVLVNNAGITLIGSAEETSVEEAKQLFETNFFGVLRLTQLVLPVMRGQRSGRILNISSVVGFLPAPYMAVYAASKHAIEGYSQSLDHELRQFGIRASLIEPGFTRTRLAHNGQTSAQLLEAYSRERGLVLEAINDAISNGDDPATVASVVVKALRGEPRLRYQAGREAKMLDRFRKWVPSQLLDKGLRKQFGLPVKPEGHSLAAVRP
jgi:NAD(P)-dependent dehydrogenase (short-subunit alcohol dehydrogenase family)